MESISSKERNKESYYEYLLSTFHAEKIDENRLKLDNELAEGEIFFYEDNEVRIVASEYIPKEDIAFNFYADPNFQLTMYAYADQVEHIGMDKKKNNLSLPSGFLVLRATENIKFNIQRGKKVSNVIYFVKKIKVSLAFQHLLDNMDIFLYHVGNNTMAIWYKLFFDEGRQKMNEEFIIEWTTSKLKELFIYIKNILYTYSQESDDEQKNYTLYELNSAFKIYESIDNNIFTKPDLMELSTEYGIQKTKLNQVFNYCFGETIYHYFKTKRIERVKEDLKIGEESLSELVYKYGFTDISHLSKSFKEAFGITPKTLIQNKPKQ